MRRPRNINSKEWDLMRKITLIAAAMAATTLATPAMAQDEVNGEFRIEGRGGVIDGAGQTEAVAGVAAGYDFDLSETVFIGVEGSVDFVLANGGNEVFGATGRVGVHASEEAKLFAAGGRSFVGDGDDAWHLGAGVEYDVTDMVYLKAEYRHFFADFADADSVVAGVGLKF